MVKKKTPRQAAGSGEKKNTSPGRWTPRRTIVFFFTTLVKKKTPSAHGPRPRSLAYPQRRPAQGTPPPAWAVGAAQPGQAQPCPARSGAGRRGLALSQPSPHRASRQSAHEQNSLRRRHSTRTIFGPICWRKLCAPRKTKCSLIEFGVSASGRKICLAYGHVDLPVDSFCCPSQLAWEEGREPKRQYQRNQGGNAPLGMAGQYLC